MQHVSKGSLHHPVMPVQEKQCDQTYANLEVENITWTKWRTEIVWSTQQIRKRPWQYAQPSMVLKEKNLNKIGKEKKKIPLHNKVHILKTHVWYT